MAEQGNIVSKPQVKDQRSDLSFAVCKRCNTILSSQAVICHVCGNGQIEKCRFLDLATRYRDIIRSKTSTLPR